LIDSISWNLGVYQDVVGTSPTSSESAKAKSIVITLVKVQRNDTVEVNAREIYQIKTRKFYSIDNQTYAREMVLCEKNASRVVIA
jgi:hypothetical protein